MDSFEHDSRVNNKPGHRFQSYDVTEMFSKKVQKKVHISHLPYVLWPLIRDMGDGIYSWGIKGLDTP